MSWHRKQGWCVKAVILNHIALHLNNQTAPGRLKTNLSVTLCEQTVISCRLIKPYVDSGSAVLVRLKSWVHCFQLYGGLYLGWKTRINFDNYFWIFTNDALCSALHLHRAQKRKNVAETETSPPPQLIPTRQENNIPYSPAGVLGRY